MIQHPLLNPDSQHYDQEEITGIEALEQEATVIEQIGWAKGNLFKYKRRQPHKGEAEKDARKIETFERYLRLLSQLPPTMERMITVDAFRKMGIQIDYSMPAVQRQPSLMETDT